MQGVNWVEIVGKFGLPSAVLLGIAAVLYRQVTPFLIKHFESSQALLKEQLLKTEESRRQEQKEFMAAMERRDQMAAEVGRQQAQAMNAMAQEIRSLTDKVNHRGSR
jgi:seryl-tRNA synthetase